MDEPTVGLDPKQIIEIRELIRKLSKKHTVILSSHILAEVREVCDHILIISKGKTGGERHAGSSGAVANGSESVEIETNASEEKVHAALQRVEEIDTVQTEKTEIGTTYARIQVKPEADIREKVFIAFAEEKTPLLTLKAVKASLEEVFMELTQGKRRQEKMLAIYKREVKSYFQSMIGCVFVAFLTAFTGIYFTAYNLTAGYPYFSYTLSGSLIVFLVGIPLITMKSFAEERKNKTDQLLLTAPISLVKVVLGKYLAMVTVVAVPNMIFCLYPLLIQMNGTAYLKIDYISIGVFFLLGCVYIAIGMFMSALTESQIIAFISTFGVLLVLYLWDGLMGFLPSSALSCMTGVIVLLSMVVLYLWQMTSNRVLCAVSEAAIVIGCVGTYLIKPGLFENLLTKLLGNLALANVFTGITANHIVDVSGLALYLSVIVVCICLTIQAIQKKRWS